VHTEHETIEKDHGRNEKREAYSIGNLEEFDEFSIWPGLKSVTMIVSTREVMGKSPTMERRYYLSSLEANAEKISSAIRAHWGIENKLHWILDVDFHEDYARNRINHSAENMAMMRHMALNLIKIG
jgi:predicted transposase YbfD/YdcC